MATFSDKVKRRIAALGIINQQYQHAKSNWNLINWYQKHHKNKVPIEKAADKDYIDWFYRFRPMLLEFKDIHKGEDCFIVGNGPSLNKTDLNRLSGYHVFGLNKINMIFDKYPYLKLSYHVSVNSLVTEQLKDLLKANAFACPSFLSYNASKNVDIKGGHICQLLTSAPWSFYKTVTEPIHEGYTVTYVAMQLAYYMGFRNVFLVGVDHNFNQSGNPNEKQMMTGDDDNHFHPDYFKGMHWHLADVEGNEASYALAKHQFHQDGREIFNATIGGKLEIFRKVTFDEALSKAKRKG